MNIRTIQKKIQNWLEKDTAKITVVHECSKRNVEEGRLA